MIKFYELKDTYSPFLVKSILAASRVNAWASSTFPKQSNRSLALHWNFSSRKIVLQSIFTPKGLLSVGLLLLDELLMQFLFELVLTAGVGAVWDD
jgi:hypothetical protein